MPVNSRQKGKRGELEAAALLREHGFVARRGQQFAGGPDSPDLVTDLEGFHVEVKRTQRLDLYAAVSQADEEKKEGDQPLVLHRMNRRPWLVTMLAEDFFDLLNQYVFEPRERD